MFSRWNNLYNFTQNAPLFDELREQMNNLFKDMERGWLPVTSKREPLQSRIWPQMNLFDLGQTLQLQVLLPGMKQEDIQLEANSETLTLRGERKYQAPEGYRVHRQERPQAQFSRTIALPVRIDLEKINAQLQDGILTITMEKAQEVLPRKITVNTK
jgi:HSP20 family protein